MKRNMIIAAIVAVCAMPTASLAQWSDNFDSYQAGTQIHGQGGWKGWFNNPANGAFVSNAQALSAPNSVDIAGASDLVHEFTGATSGLWQFSGNVFVPTNFTGTSYMILMSDYNDAGQNMHWSTQMTMNGTTNMVGDDSVGVVTPVPLVRGQWVPFTVDIDLTNDTRVVRYNNQLVATGSWTDGAGATLNVGAVDLFANNATSVYYDNLSLAVVPEPASIAVVGLGIAALIRRRRR